MPPQSRALARRGATRREAVPYTSTEDKVIIKAVERNAGNLSYAFEQAALQLNSRPGTHQRTTSGVMGRYYGKLKNTTDSIVSVMSRHGSTPGNLKIVRRPNREEEDINLNAVALSVIIPQLSKKQRADLLTMLLQSNS